MEINYFLPSEVARLVLGYLKESKYTNTYKCFLKECPHLSEYYNLLKNGKEVSTNIMGLGLLCILEEYGQLKVQDVDTRRGKETMKTLWKQFDAIVGHLKKQLNQNKSVIQGTVQNSRTRRSIVQSRNLAIPADSISQCCRTSTDQSPEKHINTTSHSLDLETDSDLQINVDENLHSCSFEKEANVTKDSDSRRLGGQVHVHEDVDADLHIDVEHDRTGTPISQLSKSSFKPSQTDSANLRRVVTGQTHIVSQKKGNDPSVENTQPHCANNTDSSKRLPEKTVETECSNTYTAEIESNCRTEHEDEDHTSVGNMGSGSQSCNHAEKDIQSQIPVDRGKNSIDNMANILANKQQAGHHPEPVTPAKTSEPFKRPGDVTPVKLFQVEDQLRSPRRKKPKTPKKRPVVSDTSLLPAANISVVENPVPIFKKILSDTKLHEKLAATCNLVTEKAKSSHQSNVSHTNPDEHETYTASKSLEEILSLEGHLGSDLSDNIDMSDPVFESLFKLFGTDKESFTEKVKEQQETIEELEKSIHEIESMNGVGSQNDDGYETQPTPQHYQIYSPQNSSGIYSNSGQIEPVSSPGGPSHCSSPVATSGYTRQQDQCFSPISQPFSPTTQGGCHPVSPGLQHTSQGFIPVSQETGAFSPGPCGSESPHSVSQVTVPQSPMVNPISPVPYQDPNKAAVSQRLVNCYSPSLSRRPLPVSPLVTNDIQPGSPLMIQRNSLTPHRTPSSRYSENTGDDLDIRPSHGGPLATVIEDTNPYSPGTQRNAHLMIQSDLSNSVPPVVTEVEVQCAQSPAQSQHQSMNYSGFVSDVLMSDSSTPIPNRTVPATMSTIGNTGGCLTSIPDQDETVSAVNSLGKATVWSARHLMPPPASQTVNSSSKEKVKRTARAKGKTADFSTLRGLLSKPPNTIEMSSDSQPPVSAGGDAMVMSMPELSGGETITISDSDINNQNLMILSPGGKTMIEVPILACRDHAEGDDDGLGADSAAVQSGPVSGTDSVSVWSDDCNTCTQYQVAALPSSQYAVGGVVKSADVDSCAPVTLTISEKDNVNKKSQNGRKNVQQKIQVTQRSVNRAKQSVKDIRSLSNSAQSETQNSVEENVIHSCSDRNYTGYFNSPSHQETPTETLSSNSGNSRRRVKTHPLAFGINCKKNIHVRSLDFGTQKNEMAKTDFKATRATKPSPWRSGVTPTAQKLRQLMPKQPSGQVIILAGDFSALANQNTALSKNGLPSSTKKSNSQQNNDGKTIETSDIADVILCREGKKSPVKKPIKGMSECMKGKKSNKEMSSIHVNENDKGAEDDNGLADEGNILSPDQSETDGPSKKQRQVRRSNPKSSPSMSKSPATKLVGSKANETSDHKKMKGTSRQNKEGKHKSPSSKKSKDAVKLRKSRVQPQAKCTPLIKPCDKKKDTITDSDCESDPEKSAVQAISQGSKVRVKVSSKKHSISFKPVSDKKSRKIQGRQKSDKKSKAKLETKLLRDHLESSENLNSEERNSFVEELLLDDENNFEKPGPFPVKQQSARKPAKAKNKQKPQKLKVKLEIKQKKTKSETSKSRRKSLGNSITELEDEMTSNNKECTNETVDKDVNAESRAEPSQEQVLESLGLTPKKNEAALLEKLKSPPRKNMLDVLASLCCSPPGGASGKGLTTPKKNTTSSQVSSRKKSVKKTPAEQTVGKPVTPGRDFFPRKILVSPQRSSEKLKSPIRTPKTTPNKIVRFEAKDTVEHSKMSSQISQPVDSVLKPVSPKLGSSKAGSSPVKHVHMSPVVKLKSIAERFPHLVHSLSPKSKENMSRNTEIGRPMGTQKRLVFTSDTDVAPNSKKRGREEDSEADSQDSDKSAKSRPTKKPRKSVDLAKMDVDKMMSKLSKLYK